ncbi:MAG: HYR domain-containing protein, partial [Bacteroidetes bacterium]|nr:HYR domain-containing protein [Bacteroidota bacterium]
SGCPGNISLSAGATCTAVSNGTAPTVSDTRTRASTRGDHNSGDTFPLGTTTVTYTATDAAGNTSICSFTVTVTDDTDPVISGCPSNISLSAGAACTAVATWTAPTVSDNCTLASFTSDHNSGDAFPIGTTTVTYTAEDAAGNTSTCSFTVTVADLTAPTAICQNATVYLDASGQASITATDINGGSFDNCSVANLSVSQSQFDCSNLGANSVVLTVTDPSGNSSTCIATVTVVDNSAPGISCPANIAVSNDPGLCGATVNYPLPVVSDNCSTTLTLTGGLPSGSLFPVGTTTITYLATDATGLTATCSFTVTVEDSEAPSISCQNVSVIMDASGNASITAAMVNGGSTDNCGIASITASPTSFTSAGNYPVTLTVTDINGNISTCVANVTVIDNTPPEVLCQPATIYLDNTGSATLDASAIDAGSDDNSGVLTLFTLPSTFNCSQIGINSTYLLGSDPSGNMAFCATSVTVLDTISPTAVCQNITVSLGAGGTVTITPAMVGANSTDNCSGALTLALSQTTFSSTGSYSVQLTVTDASGNSSTCTSTITVVDNTPPVAFCQNATIYLNAAGTASITPQTINAGSYDLQGPVILSASQLDFNCNNLGPNNVTLIVTDNGGNNAFCIAEVTVLDTIAPNAVCQDITVGLDQNGTASITAAMIGANSTDNCGAGLSYSLSQSTFAAPGTYTVQLTVTDGSGNSSTCTSTVIVADDTPPIAICQDDTIYLDATGNASITPQQIDGGSYDIGGTITLSASQLNFNCNNLGSNNVTLIVTDNTGNQTFCLSTVTVLDTIAPMAVCQNLTVGLDPDGTATITGAMIGANSTDNCGSVLAYNLSQYTFNATGTYTVVLTVTDASGNSSTCSSTVTVNDDAAPVAVCHDTTIYLDPDGHAGITPEMIDGGSYDVGGTITLGASQADFGCNNLGPNNVTLIVTDNSGNQTFCIAVVTVLDTIAPMAVCQNITVVLDNQGQVAITGATIGSNSTDNCQGGLSYSLSQSTFNATGTFTVTLTVTDASGNSSTCTSTVTVIDNIPPVAQCQNATIYLDGNGNASITPQQIDGGSFDNAGITAMAASRTVFGCADLGTNPVTLTVFDDMGNTATCEALVTVLDTIAPAAMCQDITAFLDPTGQVTISAADIGGSSTDNCGSDPLTLELDTLHFEGEGQFQVVLTVTDASGNTSTCTATVTTVKPQPPLVIPAGFSPNGDGIADNWVIQGLEYYPDNDVVIFNRWGNLLYQAAPYLNDWHGQVSAKGALPGDLPAGTYFYRLSLGNGDVRTGYLQMNR